MSYNSKIHGTAKQAWNEGEIVKAGFVTDLEVIKRIPTPGDYRPDFYVLWQAAKNRFYAFQPHKGGLVRCADLAEAMEAF